MQQKQNKEFIRYFPSAGRGSAISGKAGLHHAEGLLGKTNAVTLNAFPLPSSAPPFICWGWHHVAQTIPLLSWAQLSQLCPLPTSCAPPASTLAGRGEKQKRPWLCVSTAQQQPEQPCATNTAFNTNPKQSPIPATIEKINSVPAKISTHSH